MLTMQKISRLLVVALVLQLLLPATMRAEIEVAPAEDHPYSFDVMDNEYGEGHYLRVASYREEERLHMDESAGDADEPFRIEVDPSVWMPYYDMENPYPVTFRVETVRRIDDAVVQTRDYEWRMVSIVKGELAVAPHELGAIGLRLITADESVIDVMEEPGVVYNEASGVLAFAVETEKTGPFLLEARMDGETVGSTKIRPVTGLNRLPVRTEVEEGESRNAVMTYFDVHAGEVPRYTYNNKSAFVELNAEDGGEALDMEVFWDDDDANVLTPLPFEFHYFGETYTEAYIGANGTISFREEYTETTFNAYPDLSAPPSLHVYAADLEAGEGDNGPASSIYMKVAGEAGDRQWIVQWNDMYFLSVDEYVTFQAVLYEKSGDIRFQYPSVELVGGWRSHGAEATVGIQGASEYAGYPAVLYSLKEEKLSNGLALCFGVQPRCGEGGPVVTEAYTNEAGDQVSITFDRPLDSTAGLYAPIAWNGTAAIHDIAYDPADETGSTLIASLSEVVEVGSEVSIDLRDGAVRAADNGVRSEAANAIPVEVRTVLEEEPPITGPVGALPAPTANEVVQIGGKSYPGMFRSTKSQGDGGSVLSVEPAATNWGTLAEGLRQGDVLTIPLSTAADETTLSLNGSLLQLLADKGAGMELRTPQGSYRLPASELAVERLSAELGREISLAEAKLQIVIATGKAQAVDALSAAALREGWTTLTGPVAFEVILTVHGESYTVENFGSFVKRELPITTGTTIPGTPTVIVLLEDGRYYAVPTRIERREEGLYAVASSLTNSVYAVVSKAASFTDMGEHWARGAAEELASRFVIEGVGEGSFAPEDEVTRAEFAAMLVRALGIKPSAAEALFGDVPADSWFAGAAAQVQAYGLMEGYEDGVFHPEATMTRQQAMVILGRALALTGLHVDADDSSSALLPFADRSQLAAWAEQAAATAIAAGVVQGYNGKLLPGEAVSRAEAAVMLLSFAGAERTNRLMD
ncbi:S-layer homology domain-containing protein [Paenibacillus sp. PL2-23]|uniref:S-layer homology domain-containing protein n=1 Tax=Paenibacillus sp. PL2-23 TaxID=2100729 RepID=UPI0030FB4426